MVEATVACAPNQACASASALGVKVSGRSSMTSLIAAKVRPGMRPSQSAPTRSARPSSVWALGSAVMLAPNDAILSLSIRMFHEAIERLEGFTSPRAWAFALVGLHAHLTRFSGDTAARRVRQTLAKRLMSQFKQNSSQDWPWCEDVLTYDNAKLPQALILMGKDMDDPEMLDQGLHSLQFRIFQSCLS